MVGKTSIDRHRHSWSLLFVLALCFCICCVQKYVYDGNSSLLNAFSLEADRGQWKPRLWTLLTYGFVHSQWYHFVINSALLSFLLSFRRATTKELWGLFIAGIVSGGVLFIAVGHGVVVGSSAGIAALIPLCVYRRLHGSLPKVLLVLALIVLVDYITRSQISDIPFAIHLMGYAVGLGYLIAALWYSEKQKAKNDGKDIIEKANTSGYQSLSSEEREYLHCVQVD